MAALPPGADRPPSRPASPDVGSAYMQDDGTLEMSLRTETRDGTIGEAFLVIAPADERYRSMVAHLGGIKPGEGKPIPPFPAPEQ
jgi:hypothetical protein